MDTKVSLCKSVSGQWAVVLYSSNNAEAVRKFNEFFDDVKRNPKYKELIPTWDAQGNPNDISPVSCIEFWGDVGTVSCIEFCKGINSTGFTEEQKHMIFGLAVEISYAIGCKILNLYI